jgi:hypothetical protein
MKAIMLALLTTTGCFTTWTGLQLAGYPGAPDEKIREVRVPQPGIREQLVITLTPDNKFECTAMQGATDVVYHSAYRYGKSWKIATAGMFVVEGLLATYFALTYSQDKHPQDALGAGYFALDAVGTAALIFAPRKEVFSTKSVPMTTTIRSACPDGVALDIGGEVYPINAAGLVGELGQVALDDWMRAPTSSMQVSFSGRTAPIRSDLRIVTFDVPAGTLTQVALP